MAVKLFELRMINFDKVTQFEKTGATGKMFIPQLQIQLS